MTNLVLRNSPNLRDGLTFLAAAVRPSWRGADHSVYNEGNGTTEAFVLFDGVAVALIWPSTVEPLGPDVCAVGLGAVDYHACLWRGLHARQ